MNNIQVAKIIKYAKLIYTEASLLDVRCKNQQIVIEIELNAIFLYKRITSHNYIMLYLNT